MASFKLLNPVYTVDYVDDSTLQVLPVVAVKEIITHPNKDGTQNSLKIGSTSNVDIAGASNVNVFFNNGMSLYTRPGSNTYVQGTQTMSNLLMQFSRDSSSNAFARIDAGLGQSLLLSGADSNFKTKVSKVIFSDDGSQSILDSDRDVLNIKPNCLFDTSISVGGNVIASGSVFGNTYTVYRDTGVTTANTAARVSYSWMINQSNQLQLVKSYTFNDANKTTVSRVTAMFGAGDIPISGTTNVSNVPVITGGSTNGGSAFGFSGSGSTSSSSNLGFASTTTTGILTSNDFIRFNTTASNFLIPASASASGILTSNDFIRFNATASNVQVGGSAAAAVPSQSNFTGSALTATDGTVYTATSGTSIAGKEAWRVFANQQWSSDGGYSFTTGLYVLTTASTNLDGSTYYSDWVQLQSSAPFQAESVTLGLTSQPAWTFDFILAGSNNGTNFVTLLTKTGASANTQTHNLTTKGSYAYYRVIITKVQSGSNVAALDRLSFTCIPNQKVTVSLPLYSSNVYASNVATQLVTLPSDTSNVTFRSPAGTSVTRINSTGDFVTIGNVTSFGSISDQRFKTSVQNLEYQSVQAAIQSLRPVSFTWKDDIDFAEKAGTADVGLIAQEVEQVLPELVDTVPSVVDGREMKVVRYEKLIPYLLKATQMLLAVAAIPPPAA